ncbi:HAMP domain-containing sensor histidine kinase [Alkalihalobacillus pseudalcaliphilus]|uniref:HAMP domain-containing sensor histidine kinase n=1 Tax=Alkalihalobacillus pseudalcaliphilus TaxID=79884 RepID=UPI00064D7646|nr:HAMP domain-containing sensor histidine kinase [Alkalihalobacillus pseudalcaliphilus]KMK76239.1 histidine kinase [Alkalihalobacillus pseudalcaliphilus]
MVKYWQSFRVKMMIWLMLSLFLAGVVTYIFYSILRFIYYNYAVHGDFLFSFRQFLYSFNETTIIMIVFIPLFILFYLLFMNQYTAYFNELSKGIRELAKGNFEHRVNITSHDEFKFVANDLHSASQTLKEAIEKGEFAESSKDYLVVNLAHDLRTPLTSVLGYIELILHDEQLSEDEKKHYLKIAFNKSQRLEKLIDQLFEITKVNYGKKSLKRKELQLSNLLYQLYEEMIPLFEQAQLQVRMEVEEHVMIDADGDLLARVFENLLTNGIRYGVDGEYIDLKAYTLEGSVIVEMINYGEAIPSDEIPYLFDMFYTGDKSRTHQKNSSGLGLFIAKNIIEQHNGEIVVESNVKRTVFKVIIPNAHGEA